MTRLKYLTEVNPTLPRNRVPLPDDEVTFLPMERIGENGELDLSLVRPAKEISQGYTAMLDGDVVVAKITPCFENGKGALCVGLQGGIGFGTTELIVIRAKQQSDPRFLYWLTRSHEFRNWGEAEMIGSAGQKRVTEEFVSNFRTAEVSPSRQRRIAAYLDEQTTKIDRLMDMRRRQMELLKEQRASIIQQAVTRGLNPNAPMKDSGISWLGEIPAHWEILPLKRELKFVTSGSRGWAEHYSDTGKLFLRIGNLTHNSIDLDFSDVQLVDVPIGTEGERTRVQPGDLLISITADLGSVAVAPDNIEESYVSQHVALARPTKKYSLPQWLGYMLLSRVGKYQLEMAGLGGTKIQLALDDVKSLLILRPPRNEQKAILEFIGRESNKTENLIKAYARQLTLLAEYRASLIHECVTGQRLMNDAPPRKDDPYEHQSRSEAAQRS